MIVGQEDEQVQRRRPTVVVSRPLSLGAAPAHAPRFCKVGRDLRQCFTRRDGNEPIYLKFAKEFELADREEGDFFHSANRAIIKLSCAYFGVLDHKVKQQLEMNKSFERGRYLEKSHERRASARSSISSEHASRKKLQNLAVLMLLVYLVIVTPYLLTATFYQYRHDLATVELHKSLSPQPGDDGTARASNNSIMRIKKSIAETRGVLRQLDADFSHTPIMTECRYLICIARIGIFVSFLVFNKLHKGAFDYHVVRDLLDKQETNENLWSVAQRQALSYLESNRIHNQNPSVLICSGNTQDVDRSARDPDVGPNQRIVLEMLSSGALLPLHKLPAWTRVRARFQFSYHVSFALSMLLFDLSVLYGFFLLEASPGGQSRTEANLLARLACVSMLIISNPNGAVHPPLFLIVVQEKITHIAQLCRLIKQCIYLNSKIFYLHMVGGESRTRRYARTINSNIIFTLLQYKIFKEELKPLKISLGYINFIALLMLLWTPIIARVHQPYLDETNVGQQAKIEARYLLVTASALVLVPVIIVTMPLCYMQARCKDLYKRLAGLAAHMAEVRSHPRGMNAYDKHAEDCLLREVCDPHLFMKFTTASFGPINASYTSLIEVLLWYFLFMLSLMFIRIAGVKDTLEWLLDDPFRAFS